MNTRVRGQVEKAVRDWVAAERGTTVDAMRITRSAYASSATILNVHLTLAGGERLRAVYKLGAPDVKPSFIADPMREGWMYRCVLAADGVAGAPRLLGSGDGWLLLEWAGSVDLGQVGSPVVWCEAAARLARLHVWGEAQVDELTRGAAVRWDDPRLQLLWARRARAAAPSNEPLAPLWRRYTRVAERLAAMPRTLVHGDFNASNVLVSRTPTGNRIRVIDWETAGVGPGLLDLASLMSGHLSERHRVGVVAAYRANLEGGRLAELSDRDFAEALSWCRLALAVRWLGWAPGWSAPEAHAQDWRGEALLLARELGLLEGE
jgi:hypothetical protein